jgi:hypothetical protein
MGNTNNINDDGLNAIQTQTLEDFANSLCCSACKSSKSSNNTIIEVCVCVCVYVLAFACFSALSLQLSFPAQLFFLSVCFSHISLSLISLSMNTDTPMDERFENLFSKVSIGDDAKNGPRSRVGVFGRRGFTRANSVLDSVRPKRRRGELQRSQHARE